MSRDLNDLSPVVRPKVDQFLTACKTAGLDVLCTALVLRPKSGRCKCLGQ